MRQKIPLICYYLKVSLLLGTENVTSLCFQEHYNGETPRVLKREASETNRLFAVFPKLIDVYAPSGNSILDKSRWISITKFNKFWEYVYFHVLIFHNHNVLLYKQISLYLFKIYRLKTFIKRYLHHTMVDSLLLSRFI